MSWTESERSFVQEHLDAHGDIAPPWERFPALTRRTIGWRMGFGEDWMHIWSLFLRELAPDVDARSDYLRRHAPAPVTWADAVYRVLHPDWVRLEESPDVTARRYDTLLQHGYLASDVAFETWRRQQQGVRWPWKPGGGPEEAARFRPREFWFSSRQIAGLRREHGWSCPLVPPAWRPCAHALESGEPGPVDPKEGWLTLAKMLCAGEVLVPSRLGLEPADVVGDPSEGHTSYADAFCLWAASVFDDAEQLRRYLDAAGAPSAWHDWLGPRLGLS